MSFYFDYIYYRICKLYYKYDKGKGVYAFLIISMTEGLFVMDFLLVIERLFFTAQELQDSKIIGPIVVMLSILPFLIINYLKYIYSKEKYKEFDNHYRSETRTKKVFKGFLIVISLLFPWLLLFVMNALNQCSQCVF